MAYPEDIRYFSKYRCRSAGINNYKVTVPEELSLFFSFEAKTDYIYTEIMPDNSETKETIKKLNQKNMLKYFEEAENSNDPTYKKLIKLQKLIVSGKNVPIVTYAEYSLLSRQVLKKYGYEELTRFIEIEVPEGHTEKQLALFGEVLFNFGGKIIPKNIQQFTDKISTMHPDQSSEI